MRNCKACPSVIRKSFIAEKSTFQVEGPIRLLRPQLPNSPASGLVNASRTKYRSGLGLLATGDTPATQCSRLLCGTITCPAESHELVTIEAPFCTTVMVLTCQPPTTWLTMPPRFNIFWPFPNGRL